MFNLSGYLTFTVITSFTPGPNNIMSMNNAGRFGLKKSFPFVMGMFLGFLLLMLACAAFCAALYHIIPVVLPYIRILGAAYMLWLAYTTLRSGFKPKSDVIRSPRFISGMLLQFVNPKVMIYGITAITSYVLPRFQSLPMLLLFALILTLTGFCSMVTWSLFGAALKNLFEHYSRIISIILALALVYCAVSLFL